VAIDIAAPDQDDLAIPADEGETVTSMLLARRFAINPVLVILALVF
jgi:hypothetical protein